MNTPSPTTFASPIADKRMSKHLFSCVLASLSLPMLAACQDNPEPKSVLNNAIAAHGGLNVIQKPRLGIVKGSMAKIGDSEMSFEESFDLPKRWKRMTTVIQKGEKSVSGKLKNDGKLWEWVEGEKVQEKKDDGKTKSHFEILAILAELLDDRMKYSPLAGIKINDRRAIGFRATWPEGEGDYYFDKETGLLVQTNMRVAPEPGVELDFKVIFGDQKEVDGVRIPHRLTTYMKGGPNKDYVLMTDIVITEARIMDKLPEGAFSLPK